MNTNRKEETNVFFAHSGGVTAVVNSIACGVIETASQCPNIDKVLVGRNGILGAIQEDLIDTSYETAEDIKSLKHTPASAFGTCRYKLSDPNKNKREFQRILEVFAAHNIRYFLYNGGNDSQDTTYKIWQYSQQHNYPLTCIGIPKTVDNDLAYTDFCPGFPTTAKYIATSVLEASLDVLSMSATSTKVFILEVMGRHAGWIAAASGLAKKRPGDGPHIILFPEVYFNPEKFYEKMQEYINQYGYCVVVASEGLKAKNGQFLSETETTDAFGHKQLGGVAPLLANMVKEKLKVKVHWAVADYLQRSAGHLATTVDVEQAYLLGKTAIEKINTGKSGVMLTLERKQTIPHTWNIGEVALNKVANVEHFLPKEFRSEDDLHISQKCIDYLQPLICGESPPPFSNGIPDYVRLRKISVLRKLTEPYIIE